MSVETSKTNGNQANDTQSKEQKFDEDMNEIARTHQLPLQHAWTLWHTAPSSGGGWNENYKQIAQFQTVCEFWRLFNNIAPPSLLDSGSSYHLFKGKVTPAWEDKFNANGGAWAYRFGATKTRSNQRDAKIEAANAANYAWYHSVLNMIGNNFEYSEDICGLVISVKKGGRGKIELWIKDAKSLDKVKAIGKQFKNFSGAGRKKNFEIEFMSFEAQLSKQHGSRHKLKL